MVSKMVSDRQKYADDFGSWIDIHGVAVAKGLVARMGAKADPSSFIHALSQEAAKVAAKLVAADEAHTLEVADDAAPRSQRDGAAKVVGKVLQELRDAVSAAYGDAGLTALGLHESLPKDPVPLARVAKRFLGLAGAKGFKMPAAKREGVKVDVSVFVAEVQPAYATLDHALAVVDKEAAELQSTQKGKDDALEAFNTFFVAAAAALRGLAVLGGVRDLGDKLPSLFKASGGPVSEPEAPEPPTDG